MVTFDRLSVHSAIAGRLSRAVLFTELNLVLSLPRAVDTLLLARYRSGVCPLIVRSRLVKVVATVLAWRRGRIDIVRAERIGPVCAILPQEALIDYLIALWCAVLRCRLEGRGQGCRSV
jgi:hypothetical protein